MVTLGKEYNQINSCSQQNCNFIFIVIKLKQHQWFSTYRFDVAIKRSKQSTSKRSNSYRKEDLTVGDKIERYESEESLTEVDHLMEEAKTMYSIGSYHENIVNLQGIAYETDFDHGRLSKVTF